MNARPLLTANPAAAASPASAPARQHAWLRHGALAVALLCASAQAQENVSRLVASDAVRLLGHRDPTVRGEAALIVAAAGRSDVLPILLSLSRDPDDRARHRALIALGYFPTPGVVERLQDLLASVDGRTHPDGVAAAFALGSLPNDSAGGAVSRILSAFPYASWKRQRDTLVAMLLGMSEEGSPREVTALRRLYDDESNRDPIVRALLLQLLLPIDRTIDLQFVQRALDHGSEAEATATLQWLANQDTSFDGELVAQLERMVRQSRLEEHRVAALATLTRLRYEPALALATRALSSGTPKESAQGMRSILRIGGAKQRRDLESLVMREANPLRKAALLASFDAPPSTEMADHCARLGADRSLPFSLRTAATTVLARSAPNRAGPLLRDLFRATTDNDALPGIAAELQHSQPDTAPLSRLLDGPTELWQHPSRWTALLGTAHPQATRQLLQCLEDPDATAERLAMALASWRRAAMQAPRSLFAPVPEVLRSALDEPKQQPN